MAYAIPGIIFGGIFASIATSFMPLYSKIVEEKGDSSGNKFTSEVINLLILASIVASIIGIVFSDQIVTLFASGFVGETKALTSFFVKVTFTYTLFSSISGIIDAYLQYKGVFLSQIIALYAQNIMIITVIIISAFSTYYYLAFGMLLGTFCRMTFVLFIAKKKKFKYILTLKIEGELKKIATLAIPVFIGSSIQQVSTFVDKTLASGLTEGSVSALNYAMILVVLITGMTTGIFVTVVYPKITKANSLEDYNRLNDIVSRGMTLILMVTIPCTLGAMLYSEQVVQIVYERGAFDLTATSLTAAAFFYYAIGLSFMSINDLLIRTYYSMHDMKLPMIFSAISVIIGIVLNLILIKYMAHRGLALATSIGFMINSIMLLLGLRWKYPQIHVFLPLKKLIKLLFAGVVAVGGSYVFYLWVVLPLSHAIYMRSVQLLLTIIVAGLTYLVILLLIKVDEVKMIKQIVRR